MKTEMQTLKHTILDDVHGGVVGRRRPVETVINANHMPFTDHVGIETMMIH
jgi:hypothetical protein